MSNDALFQLMRLNIFNFAATEAGSKLDKGYVYAWAARVYPLLHDEISTHRPFTDDFEINSDMMERLTNYLFARWRAANTPTYCTLETEFGGKYGWDRPRLMRACRYLCLTHRWADEAFRSALIKNRPSEEFRLAEPFDWNG
jgi:hypothetical protein